MLLVFCGGGQYACIRKRKSKKVLIPTPANHGSPGDRLALSPPLISVSPNPTRDKAQILSLESTPRKVDVLDLAGRLVASFLNTATLDLVSLPSGSFMLRIVSSDDEIFYLKIIKE